jgi:sortase A
MKSLSKKSKLIVVVLVLIATILLAMSLVKRNASLAVPEANLAEDLTQESTSSAFESLSQPELGVPKRITITKNAKTLISTDVIMVGKDSQDYMETPKNWSLAGWYNLSSKTAQNGNIIINGHYDDNLGRPAAFWQLNKVAVDDMLSIVDEFNRPFDYKVTEVYYLSIDDPDRFKIFNYQKGTQTLTLITCGGVWLPGENTYNKRLVVRALRTN